MQYTAEGGAAVAPAGGTHTQEGENMVRELAGTRLAVDEKLAAAEIKLFQGGAALGGNDDAGGDSDFDSESEGGSEEEEDSEEEESEEEGGGGGGKGIGMPGQERVDVGGGRVRRRAVFEGEVGGGGGGKQQQWEDGGSSDDDENSDQGSDDNESDDDQGSDDDDLGTEDEEEEEAAAAEGEFLYLLGFVSVGMAKRHLALQWKGVVREVEALYASTIYEGVCA